MESRRIDIWVGRIAAIAGLAYVVLAGLRSAKGAPAPRTVAATGKGAMQP